MLQLVIQSFKIVTIGVMSLLVVLGGSRFFDYYRERAVPDDIGKTVTISIRDDDTIETVAARLHDRGLIRHELYFKARMQVTRKDIKPGRYRLQKGMTIAEIIDVITGGEPRPRSADREREEDAKILKLTVIEGWRTEQIADELDRIGYKPGGEAFLEAVRNYPSDRFDFLADRPDEASLEGYLFPDTYDITANEPPEDIIQKLLLNFDQKVTPEMRQRAEEMGLTLNELLTFASMVEREAQDPRERPIIADVYLNRWEIGMRMEADPTVQYAIGKRDGEWWSAPTVDDLYVDSPFNTYQYDGLPPHPICNPGLDSIRAVLFPGGTHYLFFVAKADDSGQHWFATNADDQAWNIAFIKGEAETPAPGSDPFANDASSSVAPSDGGSAVVEAASVDSSAGGSADGVSYEGEEVPIVPVGGEAG